jgi:L-alanine-DL-glutamate epimerase-like enolase superfamily enzyme
MLFDLEDEDEDIAQAEALRERLGLQYIFIDLNDGRLPNPAQRFCKGTVTLVRVPEPEEGHGVAYQKSVRNPTWADLLRAADESVRATGDLAHVVLEWVKRKGSRVEFWLGR